MKYLLKLLMVLTLLFIHGVPVMADSSTNLSKTLESNDFIQISKSPSRMDSFLGNRDSEIIKEFSRPLALNSSGELVEFNKDLIHYYDLVKKLIDSEPKKLMVALDHSGFIEIKIKKGKKILEFSTQKSVSGVDEEGKAWVNNVRKTYSELLLYLSKPMKL